MLTVKAHGLEDARHKLQAARALVWNQYGEHTVTVKALGTWEDDTGEYVFADLRGVVVTDIRRKWVDAIVDGEPCRMRPNTDRPAYEDEIPEFRITIN